ncbi:MAG: amidohydrolase family protein, partial [bacterium]|nr:amidohydrolase family protein [Candidatus Colisoma equi]
ADAVAAANGQPIRLLHAASWKPTEADLDKSVKFLNKSCLVLDLSGLPANAMPVWTDVDGNDGTLTVKLVYADTVVYGTIRTAEAADYVEGAIAIADGKYVYVGDEAGAAAFIEDGVTEIVDHRGKGMVMPGCTDGHSHYTMKLGLANMKGGVLFDMADDKTNVLKKVQAAADAAKAAGKTCIFGFGWSIVALRVEDPPTLQELDEASLGLSMVIFAQGGHHAYCNTECLKRCKILSEDGKTVLIPKIDGGLLELDEKDYPTGFVDERVTGYLMRMGGINFDEIVDDEVAEASIRASQELLLSTGYTTALEGWSNILHPSKFYEAAHRMDTNGVLTLVFPMTYEVEPWQTNMTEQIDYLDSLNKTYGTSHVLPEYLKVFMDGCVESMTGAMITPYTVSPYEYKSFWSVDRLAEITANCNAKGLTVHTHVMGDAAVKETTDAYIQGGDGTHRNCMVHLRHVRQEDYQRFADNNIACSAGFTWHVSSKEMDDLLKNFLDDEYIKHAYPMKSFFDAGVRVSSHSDFPANEPSPQDPFGIMQVALTGMVPNPAEDDKPFDTDELVTVEQVFQALTLNGAWQLGLENERGSIAVGKYADFVLADQDVFECEKTEIGKTKVVSTWFEGEKVYQVENGSKDCPWKIGAEDAEDVIAYTNANGRLEISGLGNMQDFESSAPWAGDAVTEILVGEGVESIGANAFAGCTGLKVLVLEDEEPPELADGTVLEDVQIFVPAGAEEAYRTAEVWSGLAERIFAVYSRKEEDLVKGRLYEVEYRWWDAQGANEIAEFLAEFLNPNPRVSEEDYLFPYQVLDWYEDIGAIDALEEWLENPSALCTSCRTGNFIGRNFDWAYDDVEECVMRVPAAERRFASIGIASRFFPEPWQTIFGVEDFLPELTMDGINEKGVAINVNVVPAGDNGATTGTNPNGERLCAGFAVRHVLDAATNAAHAVEILESKDIYSIPFLEFHWMISDSAESYIVECVSNKLVVLKAKDAQPKMANFYVSHSPSLCEYEVLTNAELTANVHTPHAMGIERYARVSNGLDRVDSVDAMFTNMTNVWYKLKYLPGNEERYWSDLNGAPVPGGEDGQRFTAFDNTYELCVARSNAFEALQANYVAVTNYEAQYGDRAILYDDSLTNQVVHTVHTSLYDLKKRTLRVCVQEDCDHTFDIWLDGVPGSRGNPWLVGATTNDTVTAWTNGTTLVVEGRGAMKDFDSLRPWGTDITAVDFGAQVTNFGVNAFAGCNLTSLTMRGNPPAIGSGNDFSQTEVIVREDALAKFKAAEGWENLNYGEAMKVCYDYSHMKTLAPFLHEVWYDDYVFDEKGETLAGVEMFSCSSVRNGNFIGRNFDFFLDDKPEFVVHVAANPTKGRLASVAMAMHTGMREDGVTNGQYTASYDLTPNRTLDGINECGVAINQNVVAYDPEVAAGPGQEFHGTNPNGEDLNISLVTRMVLDRATNAAHAVELIKGRNLVGMSVSGDLLHYMISDPKETYVVEIITNTVVARHFRVMTNFALNWDNENACALTDADNEKWTMKYYEEPSNLVVSAGNFVNATNALAKFYARHAEGVERFVRLREHYDGGATFEGMEALMRLAQYSQSSTTNTLPYWYSDRCSVALDKELVGAGYPEIANTYMLYGLKYYPDELGVSGFDLDLFMETNILQNERFYLADKDRYRKVDTGTWLTVHNTTYDISNRMFRVAVQEDYDRTFDIYLSDRPDEQPVSPGEPLGPYKTAEKATNVAQKAVLAPSKEVSDALETDEARRTYCDMFGFVVDRKEAGVEPGWYVKAFLYPEDWTNVVKSAQEATRQIPLAAIAAWQSGDDPVPVYLTNCVPGFFYSLYDGAAVTNLKATMIGKDLNVLCGMNKEVLFPEVAKPIGGQNSGFFSIGVLEIPGVMPGSDGVPVPPAPHPGPYPYVH